ncbi:hypothetical protein EDC15_11953 [Acetobacter aceti NBRC 14818]|nr:hypothetical protein EDC15_11953 [Acetobacter aceti NBRC 14818]
MRCYGLSDDQWERIRDLLPGREGHVGGTAQITVCLSMPCCIVIVPAFPRVTCLCVLVIGRTSTDDCAADRGLRLPTEPINTLLMILKNSITHS